MNSFRDRRFGARDHRSAAERDDAYAVHVHKITRRISMRPSHSLIANAAAASSNSSNNWDLVADDFTEADARLYVRMSPYHAARMRLRPSKPCLTMPMLKTRVLYFDYERTQLQRAL